MRIPACIAVLSLLAAPAWAQTPPAAPANTATEASAVKMDLPTYVQQPEYRASIISAAKEQIKQAIPACAAATFTATGRLTVLDPARFNNGKPYAGAWVERVEASGCGPARALNVLVIAHADGPAQVVGMMPGDTHTDPNMQKNALQYAQAIAVRAAPRDCKQLAFVDTKFDGFIGLPNPEITDGRESRPWREIWTVSMCGSLLDVALTFTPNARGTALTGENPVKHAG
jgi:hypothetical protein